MAKKKKPNRIFPTWKQGKRGEGMPGGFQKKVDAAVKAKEETV